MMTLSRFMFRGKIIFLLVISVALMRCGGEKTTGDEQDPAKDSTQHKHDFLGIHHEHQAQYAGMKHFTEHQFDSLQGTRHDAVFQTNKKRNSKFKVFGWHPTYMGSAYKSYEFDLLWGVGYFSYEVNPATGLPNTIYDWKTTALVDSANKSGSRVFLTVTNFGESANAQLLGNPAAVTTLVDTLVGLVKMRKAAGVSVDFEGMSGSLGTKFSAFMTQLGNKLKSEVKGAELLLALYSVDWGKVFQFAELNQVVDYYTIMGYDYYYTGSPTAGPVAPLTSGTVWAPYNLESSVNSYISAGAPVEKLILALPYYGRQWYTEAATYPSKNMGYITSPAYNRYITGIVPADVKYDTPSNTNVQAQQASGKTTQLWYADAKTLGTTYDWVKQKGLAGVAIWALGYDNGRKELWELLDEKFGE